MRFVLLFCMVALAGCGNECTSEFAGHWVDSAQNDAISLNPDCHFVYDGQDGCISTGHYYEPLGEQGNLKLTVQHATDSTCLAPGDYTCAYTASSTALTFDCGASLNQSYIR